jgi:hypothetical protein
MQRVCFATIFLTTALFGCSESNPANHNAKDYACPVQWTRGEHEAPELAIVTFLDIDSNGMIVLNGAGPYSIANIISRLNEAGPLPDYHTVYFISPDCKGLAKVYSAIKKSGFCHSSRCRFVDRKPSIDGIPFK